MYVVRFKNNAYFKAISKWTDQNYEQIKIEISDSEKTNMIIRQLIRVILSTSMFVSGVLGFILDNTIPGKFDLTGIYL